MAKEQKTEGKTYTLDDLKTIVGAGMPVGEARLLLEEGYDPADVLELAHLQAGERTKAATDAQQATAKAMQEAMKPEKTTHPAVSCFSYPEGDIARPRPEMKYQIWYLNYPMSMFPETEHWREIELATQVQPGTYTIILKDESTMLWEVTAERDANNQIKKLFIGLPDGGRIDRDNKALIPSKTVVLYQMVHAKEGTPRRVYLKAMQEYLALTFDEPESVSA